MDLQHFPHPSRRSPVLSTRGIVATSQPLAAQAGAQVLAEGGNAMDAALATAVALTVLEPTSNGIGSDAFAIVHDGSRLHGLNASGRWPAAMRAEALREAGCTRMPERGWPAVSVPGAPAAWADLHARFGRVDFARVLEPGIAFARDGFALSPVIARLWANQAGEFLGTGDPALDGWAETFAPGGRIPVAGERVVLPGHARCLEVLRDRGVREFYEGEVAEALVALSARTGGRLSADDLAGHTNEWVEPISVSYGGHEVWEIPPNGQGIAALIALGILDGLDGARAPTDSESLWHTQIEAMKLAFADAWHHVADPAHVDVPTAGLLDPAYLDGRRALVGDRAGDPGHGDPPRGGTVYLCAADRDGMMVSYIQSNYMGFGSGVVEPRFGVSLQNRATGFRLEPDHPNVASPGKRPRHTIIPAFLTRGGEPVGPFGVMGGEMQPPGHVQVVASMIDRGFNPQAALDAPRWRVGPGREVMVEPGVDEVLVSALTARGHEITRPADSLGFGRGQIIVRGEDGVLIGGSEPRADGAAVGL